MPPGPLPNANAVRHATRAPGVPVTSLPAAGRSEPAPDCPYVLDAQGAAWWEWAWSLPQAFAWSAGDLYALARRASLEDELENSLDAKETNAFHREMRELDDRFGLTPKGMATLRWKIVASDSEEKPAAADELAPRRRVKAVDPVKVNAKSAP